MNLFQRVTISEYLKQIENISKLSFLYKLVASLVKFLKIVGPQFICCCKFLSEQNTRVHVERKMTNKRKFYKFYAVFHNREKITGVTSFCFLGLSYAIQIIT